MSEQSKIVIYTDGGCQPNPGAGGWAALLIYGEQQKELMGGAPNTTNNQMELTAAIMALETLTRPCEVELYTDSEYLKNGITSWITNWKRKGWKNSSGEPVKNRDLWERLDSATQRHRIRWMWVKGHANNIYNERVDQLATQARQKYGR
jgi:ribonuclease HI